MGIFDNYLGGLQKDFQRFSNSLDAVQTSADRIVQAIDKVETKVTELSDEDQVKKKLKQKATHVAQKVVNTDSHKNTT